MEDGRSKMEDGGWWWRTMTETSDRYVVELFLFLKIN